MYDGRSVAQAISFFHFVVDIESMDVYVDGGKVETVVSTKIATLLTIQFSTHGALRKGLVRF